MVDCVVFVFNVMLLWDYELNSDLKNIEMFVNFILFDVEKFFDFGIDLVIFKFFDM